MGTMGTVLQWFFAALAVVSFVAAVKSSIELHKRRGPAREALEALLADAGTPMEFKQFAIRVDRYTRSWIPLKLPPHPDQEKGFDARLWERARREGLVSDEDFLVVAEKHGWTAE